MRREGELSKRQEVQPSDDGSMLMNLTIVWRTCSKGPVETLEAIGYSLRLLCKAVDNLGCRVRRNGARSDTAATRAALPNNKTSETHRSIENVAGQHRVAQVD